MRHNAPTIHSCLSVEYPICACECFLFWFVQCIMGDNTENITGDIPEIDGCMPLQPEEITTISLKTKNQKGKVSKHCFCIILLNK